MTDKELHKLKRTELLELLLYLRKELDAVKQENEQLQKKLDAQAAAQMDAADEILQTVRKTAQQMERLCQAQNIDWNQTIEPEKSQACADAEKTETEQ